MYIEVFRIYRFYRKNRSLQWSLPSLPGGDILAVFLLFAYLVARLNSLDGRRRRSIRQSRLVCLWDGEALLTKERKRRITLNRI